LKNVSSLRLPLYALSAVAAAATLWAYWTRIDVVVRARGVVRPEGDAVQIVAETAGRVLSVNVHEGQTVRKGDILVQFDDRDLRLKERSLLDQIHLTEQRLAELDRRLAEMAAVDEFSIEVENASEDASVGALLADLENARRRYERAEQLFTRGLASQQSLEEARLALDRAEAELSRPSTVELKRAQAANRWNETASQRKPLEASLAAAYHDLEQCRLDMARRTVTSPVDGRVSSLATLNVGEFLSAASPVAAIAPAGRGPVVEVWLPTADRAFVYVGQPVRMQLETAPTSVYKPVDGVVASIGADAVFNEEGSGGYRVIVIPAPVAPDLELGMTLQALFISRQERLLWLLFQKIRLEFESGEF